MKDKCIQQEKTHLLLVSNLKEQKNLPNFLYEEKEHTNERDALQFMVKIYQVFNLSIIHFSSNKIHRKYAPSTPRIFVILQ